MSVKIFRIHGVIIKPNKVMRFSKEVRAIKREDALERIYSDLGSHHKVERIHIKLTDIKEISLDEVVDPIIRELSGG